jgi:hypothetical protein
MSTQRTNEELAREAAGSVASWPPVPLHQYEVILSALNAATAEQDREIERLQGEIERLRGELAAITSAGKCLAAELCTWAPKEMRGDVLRKWDEALRRNGVGHG